MTPDKDYDLEKDYAEWVNAHACCICKYYSGDNCSAPINADMDNGCEKTFVPIGIYEYAKREIVKLQAYVKDLEIAKGE